MSVGLYDYDMQFYVPFIFNLEIMKLASYYKQHNELVSLAPNFCPDRYTKFIIRKDMIDGRELDNFVGYNNIEYGGHYFTNGLYRPLPREVELSTPDLSIYNSFKNKYNTQSLKKYWNRLQNAMHLRFSMDGKTIWENNPNYIESMINKMYLVIYDYNITSINESFEYIQELNQRRRNNNHTTGFKVWIKNPIQFYKPDEFYKWYSLRNDGDILGSFWFNGILEDEDLIRIIELYNDSYLNNLHYNVCLPDNISNEKFIKIVSKIYR